MRLNIVIPPLEKLSRGLPINLLVYFIHLFFSIMSKKLFVGNIAWKATEDDLHSIFSQQGEVEDLIILKDKFTNRPKGFGFVTFSNDADADKAISELNGFNLQGRNLVVNEARPPRRDRY